MVDPLTREYEQRYRCRLFGYLGLGPGQDGFVLRSDRFTAVKFFDRIDRFDRELEVYRILTERDIHDVAGHRIPSPIRSDETLRATEMTVVARPFLLDFAGAKRPEEIPDFEPHVLDDHIERIRELFDDRWREAIHVVDMFHLVTGFT